MISEPDISLETLSAVIEEKYNFKIRSLTFVPRGECSWGYILEDNLGTKYFLKLYKDVPISENILRVTQELHDKCRIKNIIFPKSTINGYLKLQIQGLTGVLFNFIDGKTAQEQRLEDAHYEDLGELLGKIHESHKKIDSFENIENFEIKEEEHLYKVLDFVDKNQILDDEIKQKARDLIFSKKDKVLRLLSEVKVLQDKLRKANLEFVNCHGEPTPGNIMVSRDGHIFLIDWDEPTFAPKEKDLTFLISQEKKEFVLKGYQKSRGSIDLNQEVIDFYNKLWTISEAAYYGEKILLGLNSKEQNEHDLEILVQEIGGL